jgi:hypothetical protein
MTPRETVIKAMAQGMAEHAQWEERWAAFIPSATAALNALLAALPALGLKVVPVAANEAMVKSAKKAMLRAGFDLEDFADVTWSAMLAAAPDLLGTGKQALKDNT